MFVCFADAQKVHIKAASYYGRNKIALTPVVNSQRRSPSADHESH